ncbi:MAG TPA: cytochrome c, partial [Acidimicrobiales bacterium]|nr:cytochrome c [Acidimicrobiales bacterium]
ELELAANRKPYLDDEALEGPRLEKALLWGVLSLMVIGIGLPLYWLVEPNRQEGAVEFFEDRFAGDTAAAHQPFGGGALFKGTSEGGFNCAGCHGGDAAIGGEVPYTLTDPVSGELRQVNWFAPALNTATLRFDDDQLRDVLTYGRPFSPMPAWGLEGGGPMNTQQIDNLIAYMHSIELDRDDARRAMTLAALEEGGFDEELAEYEELDAELAAATDDAERESIQEEMDDLLAGLDQMAYGESLFNLNCARCHTMGYSYGEPAANGSGAFGPPLYNTVDQFPLVEDHVDFVANGRGRGEQYGQNGQASGRMPFFNQLLTTEQIEAIVEYERSLEVEEEGE